MVTDFKNRPFRPLKDFVPPVMANKKNSMSRKKGAKSEPEEDLELFLREVAGVRRLTREIYPALGPVMRMNEEPSHTTVVIRERQLFLETMQKIGTAEAKQKEAQEVNEEDLDPGRRSTGSRMKLLKRGVIRIREELDLHGFSREEALTRLQHFIADSFHRQLEAVLVITGKGLNSSEGPILQGAVASWLRTMGKEMVAEFFSAPRDKGGKGAVVVFLKKK